jgi:hypothetical protein
MTAKSFALGRNSPAACALSTPERGSAIIGIPAALFSGGRQ